MARSALGWLNLILPKDRAGPVAAGIRYGADERHRLDVYRPPDAREPAPVLMFIYGGGWSEGTRADYEFAGRAFAAAGFVTLVPDYRLVPDVHFPAFLDDIGLALHWMDAHVADHDGDASRVFLMGHSAGAYNAVMAALEGQRFGAPDMAGRLRGVIGLSGPYDFHPFDVAASINTFSQAPDPARTQPVNLVNGQAPPLMLAHGRPDTTCGVYNSQNLEGRMRAAGREVVAHYYDGIGHAGTLLALFPWLRWRVPVYRQAVGFMRARS